MNPKSQIVISDGIQTQVKSLRMDKNARYISCKLTGDTLDVCDTGDKNLKWNDFIKALPANEFRIFFYDYVVKDVSKVILIYWCPDTLPAKTRIIANGVLTSCQSRIQGILKTFKAEDTSDLEESNISKAL